MSTAEYKEKFPGARMRIQTAESRAKASRSKQGVQAWNKGIKTGPNENLSKVKKGKKNPKLLGLKRSDEQRANIAAGTKLGMLRLTDAEKGSMLSAQALAREQFKLSGKRKSNFGSHHNEETKARISNSLKSKNHINREAVLKEYVAQAEAQNIEILKIHDQYLFDMRCAVCSTLFSFTKQIFWQSKRGGEKLCPTCNPRVGARSLLEQELFEEVKKLSDDAIPNDRTVLGGKEIDVYVPSAKIGFEFTGLYWHSELQNPNRNHLLWKKQHAAKMGVKLITIFEDEFIHKRPIVLSRIRAMLGKSDVRVYARKCTIAQVSAKDASAFLDHNHIQGRDTAPVRIGLYSEGVLVSLGTFKKTNVSKGGDGSQWELSRFCSTLNTQVIGAASKILKEFLRQNGPNLISYADSRWSSGELYEKLGFKFAGLTPPNYWYTDYKTRVHRFKYTKHKLVQEEADNELTEWELAKRNNLDRIWDCGSTKWVLTHK